MSTKREAWHILRLNKQSQIEKKKMLRRIAIGSVILFLLGVLIGFVGFPALMRHMILKQVNLKPGSQTRGMWEKFPFPLNFGVYVFNVTNPQEVQSGEKPKVQEIGPFMFEEWKDKFNLEDIDDEDAVTFNMRNTFIFRPDLGLTGEEVITMAHPLIQIMSISVKRDRAAMMKLVAEGLGEMFHATHPWISAPFLDLFFRGIVVDCSSENFAAKAICLNFHTGNVKGAVQLNETHFKFSLMGASNHSDAGFFKVSRGVKTAGTVGKVLEFDSETELSTWNGEQCNRIRGTDSTIFAPLRKPDEALIAFSADLCRSLAPKYEGRTDFEGIPALRYTMDFGDVKHEPENQCFCKAYPDNCPPKGTIDLSPCNEAPMFASQPHFLNAEPKLLNDVEGLSPTQEKHEIFIIHEIFSGTPLTVARRLQFNLEVLPVPEVEVMKNMRHLLMPLFWVEETVTLPPDFIKMLKSKVFLIQRINNIFKWIAVVVGAIGLIISVYLHYANKSNEINVATAPTVESEPKF